MRGLIRKIRGKLRGPDKELSFDGFEPGAPTFPGIDLLTDDELRELNSLLPWSSWVVDSKGRRFGNRFSAGKRNTPEIIPDKRILYLDEKCGLSGKTVLELGCFEGNHSVALAQRAGRVICVDSRIENVVKTLVRCSMANVSVSASCWDVERPVPEGLDLECDILHHVGVLYHLRDPVSHLKMIAPYARSAIMLDTHVAPSNVPLEEIDGIRVWRFLEHGRSNPFAGMYDHAKWIERDDLLTLLESLGFASVDLVQQRDERNGPRVLILAIRSQ